MDETTSSSIGVESVGRYKAIFNFSGFFLVAARKLSEGSVGA